MLIRGAARDFRRQDGGARKWTPARLFAAGEQGVWYDPSDMSTLFQDAAGTTPVTAVGQPVGRMLDKSGRGNHATQGTAASRPILQQDANGRYHLAFDGYNDGMLTGSIDFTATDKMTVFAGVRKLSDVATGALIELSASPANELGTFWIDGPELSVAGGNNFWFACAQGTSLRTGFSAPAPANNTFVIAVSYDFAGASRNTELMPRINQFSGNLTDGLGSSAGVGNFGNYPLFIGRRNNATLPFNGNLYGLIVRGAQTSLPDIIRTERILAGKSGITF